MKSHVAWLKRAGIAVLLSIVVSGCSDNNSSFSISDRTRSLIPEAQTGVSEAPGVVKLLDEKFGDPQTLKAWSKLPVQWGGASAKVEVFAADGADAKVKFVAGEGQTFPEKATFVNVVTGGGCRQDSATFLVGRCDGRGRTYWSGRRDAGDRRYLQHRWWGGDPVRSSSVYAALQSLPRNCRRRQRSHGSVSVSSSS